MTPPITIHEGDLIAAVDLGSNSFHMIVARYENGELKVLDRLRDMVRLAAGMDESELISAEAMERAIECLSQFGQRLRHIPSSHIRIVGTNTLRQAKNSKTFLSAAEQAVNHPIEIIAGIEEARLIYLGVAHSLAEDGNRRLVMDIGGGSTELIIGERFEPHYMESLEMGCVTMSTRYFADGNITRKRFNKALMHAQMQLEPYVNYYRRLGWDDAVGASGTIKAVGKVVNAMDWSSDGITVDSLQQLADAMIDSGSVDNLKLDGLSGRRRPVFPGGVAVLLATFEALGIERMQVSDGALREGLLYDLVGRIRHEDVRTRTVENMANRYSADAEQAERITTTALTMFDAIAECWGLNEEPWRNLLEWGCRLHEIGLSLAHNAYHKHGAYLVENSDMPGFSTQEQALLALLLRGQQRKIPLSLLKGFAEQVQQPLLRVMVLLRIAILLHRNRNPEPLSQPQVNCSEEGDLSLQFPEGWLADHPLSYADLEQEASYLSNAGITLTYE